MTGSRHEIPRITNTKLHKNYFIRGCSCYYSWLLVFLLAISIFPLIAEAQGLILKSLKTTYNAGDSFSVSLSLDTKGQSVNTLSGKIQVPTSNLQILDVRYGSSIISLWVERPKIDSSGNITFVGGIPGGFSGSNGPILTFGVRAKSEGQAAINIKDIKILLNDGKGTELAGATSGILKLIISKALPKPAQEEEPKEAYIPPPDTVPPESFIPLVSSHPTIGDNKYFVSFFAVDKDSGVAKYEIVESPLILSLFTKRFDASPLTAETPYILKGQFWAYKITVRAYDQAGNFTDSFVIKPLSAKVVV
ncbi:MAG: cohesin domain-containing protein, partial [bacterium]|nr:cohesin domain-containing protein [bacterium]